ncbi:hypothetical protein PFICI_03929 [Pestalotiopsis fici W106-1]|uniref:Heterokaryon incompatibility domain-containing protein n=1 Tax=Pestalotiopsis fici (strain W106-1 / CGMCC3.15140) TaxID=1229662 RepID=W3XIR8_PESFW|nr:uncharacterized protein PFICI_03929 [Pestalotiopsis fici W106-1]ETS85904.1 hypothetical protein PFICI_03929 [Pestalotiopsis fici W106-1]
MASIPFQYTPLDKGKTEIRLLEIIPQVDSSLKYSLTTSNLKTSPPYIALSYTWGNDEPSHTIVVNGRVFKVRDNLSYVLPHLAKLRRNGEQSGFRRDEQYFWIDAICIDQQDTKERNHQVAIMADIFNSASLTIAWLGPEDEHFRTLTTVNLGDLQKSRDSRESHANLQRRLLAELQELQNHGEDGLSHPLDSPTPYDAAFDQDFNEDEEQLWHQVKSCMEKIACMEYFTRMWIIQEILLSRELWVMCGNSICTWRALEECWLHCFGIGDPRYRDLAFKVSKFMDRVLEEVRNPTDPLHSVMASRFLRNERSFRLDVLVHLYHDRRCKDPLD